MKTVIKALLAASALLPVAAYAQRADWQTRADHRGAARANRGDDGRQDRSRGRTDVQPQTRPDAGFQAQPRITPQDRQRTRADGYADRTRGGFQAQPYRDNGSADGAAAVRRYQAERQRATRGYAPAYGERYRDRGQARSGAWNRDWRSDNRYDYSGYRASNRGLYRLPRYYAPSGYAYGYRRFGIGSTLSAFLWDQNYWIDDPYAYRLPEAYGPYRWVRYYDDALLIDIRTGGVVDSVYGIFY